MDNVKNIFIPLKSTYFESFRNGSKTFEYRLLNNRWSTKNIYVGRGVTLSKGYGKKHRLTGVVKSVEIHHGSGFPASIRQDIIDCYGDIDVQIICIGIKLDGPPKIYCDRCKMSFEVLDVPHDAKRSLVCEVDNCTRSYSENGTQLGAKLFQTGVNVANTVKAANYRRENKLPVDNGGHQEGISN